ncbi:hypothetical protein LB503_007470 [Fusarium chuoi]|nr:hypothetical protein LB503_007470 [Fusarium chuoi]
MSPSKTHHIEPWKLTASEALGKIQADEISVQEYAESLLERIKARDEDVKAWAYLDEKRVMQEARLLDEIPKKNRGPLHGLPIAICLLSSTRHYMMAISLRQMLLPYESFAMQVPSSSVKQLRPSSLLSMSAPRLTILMTLYAPRADRPAAPELLLPISKPPWLLGHRQADP